MRTNINKAREERDQGFTLIELLVVIIIIGILAAIAIPVFLNQRKKGVDAGLKSDLKNAATAAETWATDNPSAATFTAADPDGAGPLTATTVPQAFAAGGFKVTTNNTVKVTGGPAAGYQLCAFNTAASTAIAQTAGLQYTSTGGGLITGTVDCTAWTQIH